MENEAPVCLVFTGEVLEGFQIEDVKRGVGEVLKVDDAKLTAMFSGVRTVLKRSMTPAEAERQVAKLGKLGARVHIEPAKPSAAADAPPTIEPEAAAKVSPNPPAVPVQPVSLSFAPPWHLTEEEVVCPNCRERQPKRIRCRSCDTDMPRGMAAAAKKKEGARGKWGGTPPFLGMGLQGRMGRITYFNASMLSMLALGAIGIGAEALAPLTGSMLAFVPVGLLAFVFLAWALRVSALRLHDLNRSGWWTLALLIPCLGSVGSLVMMFWPGAAGDNDYGSPPRQGSGLMAIGVVVLSIALVIASLDFYRAYWPDMKASPSSSEQVQADSRSPRTPGVIAT